ncbi:conjugative transfer system coupling protein TraD [Sutterella sp.]|uniref:conjugative transfer system coupling protein TraD n=1 Tax=Sutterella sp. TaxID=1981025 RepID=UPI003FD7CB30
MALRYDPTAYETWRQNFEMRQALAWFGGCAWYFVWGDLFGASGATLCCALCCALMGLWRFKPAVRRLHMTLRLAGTPLPYIDFKELQQILNDPVHQNDMWLGRGFAWGQTQAQRVSDLLKRDWHRTYREALGALYVLTFMRKNLALCIFKPWKAVHVYKEIQKRVSDAQGQPWIHGVGDGEEDIFQPVSHTEGHTLIIGTTGSGKTRCFDLLISQAILRNETVFIIDPKGDRDLRDKARRACEMLGRGDKFLSFHPAHPEESIRINLLANWTRPSEIADRISALIPSASDSDPFKNFAFGALNAICNGLCSVYRSPTLKNLKHYLAGTGSGAVSGLVIDALNTYLRTSRPDRVKELETYIAGQKKHDRESIANALVEYYQTNGPSDSDMDDLVSMYTHNREHFGKMITSLLPILSMLTSGVLGDMLSPPESVEEKQKHTWRDTNDLIAWNHVVYVGLDSLSDPMVGSAIGALFLSDLACVAGARYNFEGLEPEVGQEVSKGGWASNLPILGRFFKKLGKPKARTVNIFVDEAAEVVNTPFLQILNKGRGAHLKLFVATQTISDFVSRMGSKDKANQLLGNLNNRISLRCIDPDTQKFVTDALPKTKVFSIQRTQGLSTTVHEPVPRGGSLGERLAEEEVPLFSPQLLGMLPNLEFIASLSGGHVIKGRYPLILSDKSEYKA